MNSRFCHFVSSTIAILAATVGLGDVRAADDPLGQALQAVFRPARPAASELFTPTFEIAGHRFGVPSAITVETGDDTYLIRGTLTHFAESGAKGESLEYRISKQRGGKPVQRAEIRLVPGRWTPLASPLMDSLTGFRTGRTLTPEQQQDERRQFESATTQALNGTWRRAAEFLIARIALGDGC